MNIKSIYNEAYYNEFDPYVAQWLRNLIKAGHIMPGVVDERSIEDVHPYDLTEYTQCHFFAGLGAWSLALRLAGWPDSGEVWTASCPCQPFSAAGKGDGFADERHLWPSLFHLIEFHRPASILGEQVASKDAGPWVDLVQADLEVVDYAFGAVPFPSAGVGAPHIRDRLYWMAHANNRGLQRRRSGQARDGRDAARQQFERFRDAVVGMADDHYNGFSSRAIDGVHNSQHNPESRRIVRRVANTDLSVAEFAAREWARSGQALGAGSYDQPDGRGELVEEQSAAMPTNGYWRDADWLFGRDGKFRPVRPGTFPLAHGASSRVGRLRAYGNAINPQQAKIFIEIALECAP